MGISWLFVIIVSGFLIPINIFVLNFSLYPKKCVHDVKYSEIHKIEIERTEIASCYSSVNAKSLLNSCLKSHGKSAAKSGPELASLASHRIR